MNAIAEALISAEIVAERKLENLRVTLLSVPQMGCSDLIGFKDAFKSGAVEIVEKNDETVPEIQITNKGGNPVFLPEGSIIEGMKQSRFLTVSMIINAGSTVNAAVLCCEQSRWHYENSKTGSLSKYMLYPSLKAVSRAQRVNAQADTWKNIEGRLRSSSSDSPTRYVGDYFASNQEQVQQYVAAIEIPDTVNGMLTSIDGKFIEFSIMATPDLFKGYGEALVAGNAVEAVNKEYCASLINRQAMTYKQFMNAVKRAKTNSVATVGEGDLLSISNKSMVGSALLRDGHLIHLGVYAR